MAWRIDFEGHTWRESELRLRDAEAICQATGESWGTLHPLRSPRHLAAIIAVLLARDDPAVDVRAKLEELLDRPVGPLLECIGAGEESEPAPFETASTES